MVTISAGSPSLSILSMVNVISTGIAYTLTYSSDLTFNSTNLGAMIVLILLIKLLSNFDISNSFFL